MTTPHQDKRFYHLECGSAPYGFFHVFERGPTEPHKFLATVPDRRAADDVVDALNNEAAQPLAAALGELLENLPRVECQDFHHTPKDYHDGFDCPVCKRWEKAIEQARDARRGWDLKGEH